MVSNFCDDELYFKIIENMPIFCMDLIIKNDNKILLVKRKNNPAKNEWWTPGGRFLKGESLACGASRKAKQETGLKCKFIKVIDVCNMYFVKVDDMKCDVHTPSLIIEMEAVGNIEVNLDRDHSEYKWIDKNSNDYHKYVQEIITKAGY